MRIGRRCCTNRLADDFAGNGMGGGVLAPRLFGLNIVVADGVLRKERPGEALKFRALGSRARRLLHSTERAVGHPVGLYSFTLHHRGQRRRCSIISNGDNGIRPEPAGGWAVIRWWTMTPRDDSRVGIG